MFDFKNIDSLVLCKNSEIAAILKRTEQGCQLQLDEQFIANIKQPYFSYCISKNQPDINIIGDNLPPFLAGLLPEGRRLNALINKIKTSQDDLFSLFAAVGKDCIGDINIQHEANQLKSPPLKSINFYSYFEELIDPHSKAFDTNSLAGVQEKISASMISFPLNIAKNNKAYILKLNPEDKSNLIQNELYCLDIARQCGFKVAKAKLVRDKDKNPGLLIERFDRDNDTKLHQEDACQFLNRYPADKYRISINQIADSLMTITQAPQLEILNLLSQYAFSYLICNGDLHAKNISLQTLADGAITLTPLYDLICTALYSDFNMALKIDGRDNNIKRKTLIEFAERYQINSKAMNSSLDTLLKRFAKHFKNLFGIEMTDKKRTLLHHMITKRIKDLE